jgi:hypothetical protein
VDLLGQIRISSSAHDLVESTRKVSQCEIRTNELRVNVRLHPASGRRLFSEPGHRPATGVADDARSRRLIRKPIVLVTYCGRICMFKKKINLSTSLAGQAVGIKEVDDGIRLVTFMDYDLGYIDLEEKTLQPLNNPFGPKV